MSLDPVKIPQNVYIEDRIVGPLTLKQTIIMTLGGGFSYMVFAMLQKSFNGNPGIVLTVIAWIPCAISVLFALVKINDLSLLRIVLLTIERVNKATVRTWAPRTGISINVRFSGNRPDKAKPEPRAEDERTAKRIRELSSIIDRPLENAPEAPMETIDAMPAVTQQNTRSTAPLDGVAPAMTMQDEPSKKPKVTDVPSAPPARKPDLANPSFSDLSVFRDVFPSDR
jgi:hypothetical protein